MILQVTEYNRAEGSPPVTVGKNCEARPHPILYTGAAGKTEIIQCRIPRREAQGECDMAFENIRQALLYIDANLEESLTVEGIAERFHFSAYYFHRMFTAIVGKSLAAHIRARRIAAACGMISQTDDSLTEIGLKCGFSSQQAFIRAFKGHTGYTPGEYRRMGLAAQSETIDEMIRRFTNRMKGGVIVKPNMIKKDKLRIAGVTGDGNKTFEVWQKLEELEGGTGLTGKKSENGYEIRFKKGGQGLVHVGKDIGEGIVPDEAFTVMELPASLYASFDVYVAQGYDSENKAMSEWLAENADKYHQRTLDGGEYVIECYDERFSGEEAGSIVEIWIPVE